LNYKRKPPEFKYDAALNVMDREPAEADRLFPIGTVRVMNSFWKALDAASTKSWLLNILTVNLPEICAWINRPHDAYKQMKRQVVYERFLVDLSAATPAAAVRFRQCGGGTTSGPELDHGKGFKDLVRRLSSCGLRQPKPTKTREPLHGDKLSQGPSEKA